jgi:hypothetical protein
MYQLKLSADDSCELIKFLTAYPEATLDLRLAYDSGAAILRVAARTVPGPSIDYLKLELPASDGSYKY